MTLQGNNEEHKSTDAAIKHNHSLPYMAKNLNEKQYEERVESPSGRKQAIDDGRLWGQRDALVFLLEVTWPHIGGNLMRIKTPADVYETLKVWEEQNRHNTSYVAQTLLRPTATPATANTLNERRRRGGELHIEYLEAEKLRNHCRTALETAQRAFSPDLSPSDKATVEEQITKRTEKLTKAEQALALTQARDREIQELTEQGEAYFARSEFAHFCKSKRYRLTPLNVANALAGLPQIGWRQSMQRCQKQACPGVDGGAMQEFNAIRQIVQTASRKSQLAKHAEQWLISKGKTKSHTVVELRKNWFYLQKAIKAALEARTRKRDLPYVIIKDYRDRQVRATNVDRLFAEEEAL
jgi:hypothetical protein